MQRPHLHLFLILGLLRVVVIREATPVDLKAAEEEVVDLRAQVLKAVVAPQENQAIQHRRVLKAIADPLSILATQPQLDQAEILGHKAVD